jgi:hypothetical protein
MYGNARDTSWRLIRNEQKKQILRVIRGMPRRGVLLAKDETQLLLFPPPAIDVVVARAACSSVVERAGMHAAWFSGL